jgi:hypothetical protein
MRQRQELQGQEHLNFINAIHSDETKRLYIRALKHCMRFLKTDNVASLLKQDTKTANLAMGRKECIKRFVCWYT